MIPGLSLNKSGNPFFSNKVMGASSTSEESSETFKLNRAMTKFAFLFLLVIGAAGFMWYKCLTGGIGGSFRYIMYGASGFAGLGMMLMMFQPHLTKFIAPLVCIAEGLSIGSLSFYYESKFPGMVLQAVMITLLAVLAMLLLYSTGLIKPRGKFMNFIMIATGAIGMLYFVSWILGMFGIYIPFIHGYGPIAIAITAATCVISAFNLIMDFDFLATAESENADANAEWTAAYGLCFTLIWLYFEILRLLYKLGMSQATSDD